MKFCTECGARNNDTNIFCSSCGQKFVASVKKEYCVNGSSGNSESNLLMTLEGLVLYKGKQPIGILKIYNDKVEFAHSGKNFVNAMLIGGIIGGIIASETIKKTVAVDCFLMSEIAAVNKSKHPKISSYIEIILKNGNKVKYLDRAGKYRPEQLIAAVDVINANLII